MSAQAIRSPILVMLWMTATLAVFGSDPQLDTLRRPEQKPREFFSNQDSPTKSEDLLGQCTHMIISGNADKAIPLLERAAKRPKAYPEPQFSTILRLLGEAYYQQGNYTQASKSFTQAQKFPDPMQILQSTISFYGFSDAYKDWSSVQTSHFIFHFDPNIKAEDQKRIIEIQEAYFETANQFFNATLPKKIDYFVWSSQDSARLKADIVQTSTRPGPCIVHRTVGQTKYSDVSRLFITHASRPVRPSLFIKEGLITYFGTNDRKHFDTACDVMLSTNTTKISVGALWDASPQTVPGKVIFCVGAAFIERLRQKGGEEKLRQLASNQTFAEAKKIYGSDFLPWVAEFEYDLATAVAASAKPHSP